MQGGAYFGPEQRVTFESRALRDAVTAMLAYPLEGLQSIPVVEVSHFPRADLS